MRKVAFIFEQPESCEECALFDYCFFDFCNDNFKCPLVPIPERMDDWYDDERSAYERGYNACLDDILRKENEND